MSGTAIHRDLRFAIKSLRRSFGFTLIAIVTLGLGIGANTSMFSILNGYMLSPAPYPDNNRLDRIYRVTPQNSRGTVSAADYLDLKPELNGYGQIAAWATLDVSLSEPGQPAETPFASRVSANLFSTLGTEPQLGRSFRSEEDVIGNHRVLIISHRYWQTRFGGDAHIIGRTVRVDGEPHTIVGVLPATFSDWRHLAGVDVFRPLALTEQETTDRNAAWLRLVGRHSTSLTRSQAESLIANFGRRLAVEFPGVHGESTWRAVPLLDSFTPANSTPIIAMLVGLSGFVLLIACSNLANLLLARTMARAREFAVRVTLGASRFEILGPLVIESLLLASAGGVAAILIARWTFDWIASVSAGDAGLGANFALDWRVLAWALGVCFLTAIIFGVAPALFALRIDVNDTLKSGSRGTTGDRGYGRFRQILIVGQFAFAMILLAGAALFARGIHELNTQRHGWESDFLVTGNVRLPSADYPDASAIIDFQRRALERLEALPGVLSASVSWSVPFLGLTESRKYLIDGRDPPKPGHEPAALVNGVSARYFETVGTRLLNGRTFNEADTLASPKVFIINQAMARGLFGEESPLGRRIARVGGNIEWGEIVGVVADVQWTRPDPMQVTYQVYEPMAQEPQHFNEIAVRTNHVAPSILVDSIRRTITEVAPDLPVRSLQTAETRIARANYGFGVISTMLSALAALGLGLACLGIYGVISRTVAQRTGEFGIRLALGARAQDITRLVLASGAKLALIGSVLGLFGAFGASRLIEAAYPSMKTNSAPVLVGATVLLIAIAQIASYLPARQASKLSPTEALRSE